jgi:hypothetical protein
MSSSSEELSEGISKLQVSKASEEIYKVGRIYKLSSSNGLIYFGSTTRTLNARLRDHNNGHSKYNNGKGEFISSFDLYSENASVTIELTEEHKDISKHNLAQRERYFIEKYECVNRNVPGRTRAEINKAYQQKHKEKIKLYAHELGRKHKVKIAARKSEKILCDVCKSEFARSSKSKHDRSKMHATNIINHNTYNINKSTVNISKE